MLSISPASIEVESEQDQMALKVRLWPTQEAKGWVHIMHGMSEHSGRYAEFANKLNAAGYHVSADDHRGHGLTGQSINSLGHLSDHNGFEKMVADQLDILDHLQTQWSQPLIIIGHSMGSFIATRVAQKYANKLANRLQALVLSGSNYSPPWLYRAGCAVAMFERFRYGARAKSKLLDQLSFGQFNNAFKPVRTPKDWISSDPKVVDDYIADPLAGQVVTTQFWFDFLNGLSDLSEPEAMASIKNDLPIYLFSGDKDPVGKQGRGVVALQKALQRAGSKQVDCKLYAGGRHEMMNEPNKKEVVDDLLLWLNQR